MSSFEKIMYVPIIALFVNFFTSGLIINLFQLAIWLSIRPLSLQLYRKLNYYALYLLWSQITFIAEWWSDSTCAIVTDDETWAKMGHEHALILMNHSYEVDWLMGWLVCEQSRLLASSKVFIKKAIKWVPVLGWAWQFGEVIFLERDWEKDKQIMDRQVANLAGYPHPVWLLLFAEGTRFTKAKHEASVAFAVKSGLPPLKHLLLPRTKGFLRTVQQLRHNFPAVIYSATLAINTKDGALPTLKNMLLGRRVVAELYLERLPLSEVPDDPDEASAWLHEHYRHKDALIDFYKTEGVFPTTMPEGREYFNGPVRTRYRPRRIYSLLIVLVTSYLTLPLVLSFFSFSSGLVNSAIALLLLVSATLGLYKLIGLTRVSKGSAYGRSTSGAAEEKRF